MAISIKHPNPEITRVLSEIQNELKALGKPRRDWNSVRLGDGLSGEPYLTIEVKYDFEPVNGLRSNTDRSVYKLEIYVSLPGVSASLDRGDIGKIRRIAVQSLKVAELAAKFAEKYGSARWPIVDAHVAHSKKVSS